jgi:hypothetical protein
MPSSLNGTGITFNDATTLQSGNIPTANLATGTANSTTFLRGDKTWQTLSASVSTATVLTATAGVAFGGVGCYVYAYGNSGNSIALGGTISGGSLTFLNSVGSPYTGAVSGTWRNMGDRANANSNVYVRVS